MRSRAAAMVAAGGLVAARAAGAEPATYPVAEALRVEPNECFDSASLAPSVARWLQRDSVDRRIEIEISGQPSSPGGVVLRVRRDGQPLGERHFPRLAASCEDVRAAVGLAAALAVDATVLESLGVKPEPALVPVTPPPPSELPDEASFLAHAVRIVPQPGPTPLPTSGPATAGGPAAGGPAAAESEPPPFLLPSVGSSFEVLTVFGVLPSPAVAFSPTVGVRPLTWLDLRLSGLFTMPGTVSFDGAVVSTTVFAGRADGCVVTSTRVARVRACAGVAVGRFQTTPSGAQSSLTPNAPWAAAIARGDVRFSVIPRFGVVLGTELIIPFVHPQIAVTTPIGPRATSLSPVGGAVSLGPEITFR